MPYVNSKGSRIYWSSNGDPDKAPLLLLNSLGTDTGMWDEAAADLAADYRVLRTDTRGHGRSDVSDGDYTIELLAEDALAVLEDAGIGKVTICGLSLGALVAAHLARHHPDKVFALILCNVAVSFNPPDWVQRAQTARSSGMGPLVDPVITRFLSPAFREAYPARAEAIRQTLASVDPQGYAACCMAIANTPTPPTKLGGLTIPLLSIGGAQDAAAPTNNAEQIATSIKGGQLRILETGHLSATEDPAGFSVALRTFLTEVPHSG